MATHMKCVDTVISSGKATYKLNFIAQGTNFYERVGTTVRIHRVTYTIYATTGSSTISDYIRVALIYDKFGYTNGLGPSAPYRPFVMIDYDGTIDTTSAFNLPTMENPDRYTYLCVDRVPVSTNPPCVLNRDIAVDLVTQYTRTDPYLGNITSGTLYLDTTTNSSSSSIVSGVCRIYYTDV